MRRAPALAVIAAIALALAACTDEPEPSGLPTNTATPPATTTPPPSTTPPRTPPAAPPTIHEHTDEGAKAAAIFFVEALEHLFNTGDPSSIQAAAIPDCTSCTKITDNVDSLYKSGGHITTGAYIVDAAAIQENISSTSKILTLQGTRPAHEQFDSSGKQIKTESAAPLQISCLMLWDGARWVVEEYGEAP